MKTACAIIALAGFGLMGADAVAPSPELPAGYRGWKHVSSGLVGPASPAYAVNGGLHHIYANALAVQGYEDGRFADGSAIVYDLFETIDKGGGATAQGHRRHIDVMVKDSVRFAQTDGWGYAEFAAGQTRPRPGIAANQNATCHACHKQAQARDFVFSTMRD